MNFIERFVSFQVKHAKVLLVIIVAFISIMAVFASQLQIDPSFSSLISDDSDFNTIDRLLTVSFEQNDALVILVKLNSSSTLSNSVTSMNDSRVTDYIKELQDSVSQSTYVQFVGDADYSKEERYIQIPVGLSVPQGTNSFKIVLDELYSIKSQVGTPVGIDSTITGFPVVLNRVSTLLILDNLFTVLFTLALIGVVLYWYFRNIVFTLVALTTPLFSLITLAGMMVLFDISITITLAAVGVLVLGLGVDYTIHISTHYRRLVREKETHAEALIHTVKDLALPITASFVTTFAGFSALILGVSPSSQAQGITLSLAIAIIFLTTFCVFPVLITICQKWIDVKENKTFHAIRKGLSQVAIYQAKHPKKVITIIFFITIIMFVGLTKVEFSTSNSNWIPEQDDVSLSFREISYVYGSPERLQLVLIADEGDLRDVQKVRDINRLTSAIEGVPRVDDVDSIFETFSYNSATIHDQITHTYSHQFNNQYTITTIPIISSNLGIDDAGNSIVLPQVRELVESYSVKGTRVLIYGDALRFEELAESLQRDTGITTMIGLALVFLASSIVYMSLAVGLLALSPIIIAIIWAIGLMGYFGVPFTSLSTGIVSLVLGIGVDFSIHLVDSIKRAAKNNSIEQAITHALTGSGSAILLSSITTFAGFMALTFASLLGTQRLGLSLSFSILAVFVVSIVLVPAIMGLLLRRGEEKKKVFSYFENKFQRKGD